MIAQCVTTGTGRRYDAETETLVATTLRARDGAKGVDSDCTDTLIPVAFSCKDHGADAGGTAPTLRAMGHAGSHANAGGQVAVAYRTSGNCGAWETGDRTDALTTSSDPNSHVVTHALRGEGFDASEDGTGRGTPLVPARHSVRRLTPRECERLQGFPDDWTAIQYRGKPAADGPRYKAIGNSMAVPVMDWIARRIAMVRGMIDQRSREAAE